MKINEIVFTVLFYFAFLICIKILERKHKMTLTEMRSVTQEPSFEFAGRPLCSQLNIPCN